MKTAKNSARENHFLPWCVQETQDNVVEIAGGKGVYFWDSKGHRYLDFVSQLFNVNLGHGNQRIIQAIQEQALKYSAASPSVMHQSKTLLGARLAAITPGDLCKAFFTNSGSEANEIAFTMARLFTGRNKIFAKYRSYHGTTLGTLNVSGDPRRITIENGVLGAVRFFGPYCYRCDFNLEYPECDLHCALALDRQIEMEGPDTVAAIVLEPFTAAAGGFPSPPGYLKKVREICDRYQILMIADEVISGFGRTGEWFAVQHEDVVPDILTTAKGITSGYVPLGAAIVNPKLANYFEDHLLPVGCTYSGHPLACAAALASIKEYETSNAISNSHKMGKVLSEALSKLKANHPCIGDVRSQGLFACIELVKNRQTRERLVPFNQTPPLVGKIKQLCIEKGLYLFNRWNLILLAPPLIINEKELQAGIEILDEVLSWVDQQV